MERAAFVLRHFEGQSIDEISRTLGLEGQRGETQRVPRGAEDAARARAVRRRVTAIMHTHLTDDELVLHYYGEMESADEARARTRTSARAARASRTTRGCSA